MAIYELKHSCSQCDGDGMVDEWRDGAIIGTNPCPMCNGTGKMKIGEVDLSDLEDKIDNILGICTRILRKVS